MLCATTGPRKQLQMAQPKTVYHTATGFTGRFGEQHRCGGCEVPNRTMIPQLVDTRATWVTGRLAYGSQSLRAWQVTSEEEEGEHKVGAIEPSNSLPWARWVRSPDRRRCCRVSPLVQVVRTQGILRSSSLGSKIPVSITASDLSLGQPISLGRDGLVEGISTSPLSRWVLTTHILQRA